MALGAANLRVCRGRDPSLGGAGAEEDAPPDSRRFGVRAPESRQAVVRRTSITNVDQVDGRKVRTGPAWSLESRTNTVPGMLSATSTQLPWLPLLRLDFRQRGSVIVDRPLS